jgi:hypothetical protein
MYLLTVSLLADGIPYEELSYFSKQEVTPGDLVEVTVRKRVCRALVVKVVSLKEEKQSLKHASFVTKKISQVLYKEFIHPKLWQALTYASSCALKNTGTLVHDLLSEKSFQTITSLSVPLLERGFEILLLEQAYEYRMQRYKTTIREMFSKKYSLVMFFPTLLKKREELSLESLSPILLGTIVSFVVAFLMIRLALSYIRKHSFSIFGWYRIVVGVILLIVLVF